MYNCEKLAFLMETRKTPQPFEIPQLWSNSSWYFPTFYSTGQMVERQLSNGSTALVKWFSRETVHGSPADWTRKRLCGKTLG